jgi:hypothetical protein
MENHGLKTVDLIKSWFIEYQIFNGMDTMKNYGK